MSEYNYDNIESNKELTSKFNDAQLQILRLHIEWTKCNKLSQEGNLIGWKWNLDIIWRELAADAHKKDEKKSHDDKYSTKLKEYNDNIAKANTNSKLYNALQEKELFLRILQDEVGKGTKRTETEEDNFD